MKKATADNLKISAIVTAGTLLVVGIYMLTRRLDMVIVLSIALTFLGLLVWGAMALSKWLDRRKATKAGLILADAAPPKDAEKAKVKLEALRKSFKEGLEQFNRAGRHVYEIPWYLMVGLSGVGKTEAIRRAGLQFPPNMQDEDQGKGGTQSLSWWFTQDAVILDTIGEWLLEEDGELSEWVDLFRLLKAHRPAVPFNGVMLAISAEHLMLDDDDKIKKRASILAKKLDLVQRMLEIRFPVWVLITKCDLITGFREFFDDTLPPEFRDQMLGWSNPDALDDEADAGVIVTSLEGVAEGLSRQRLALLGKTGDGGKRKTPDNTMRLMAFPENLKRAAKKLRVYLETVFLAGQWTSRPLFCRGVYFTSSKQDGWELDVEIAEAFTIPESNVIEERNVGSHRSHFLKDLYENKVFAESGLVLRASSAMSHKRLKALLTWGTAFTFLGLFILITALSFTRLENAVGLEKGLWETAADPANWKTFRDVPTWRPVVMPAADSQRKYVYTGAQPVLSDQSGDTGGFLIDLLTKASKPMEIPWVFRMSAGLQGDLEKKRPEAARALFESAVLMPLVSATRERMTRQKADLWSEASTAALAQLIRLETQKSAGKDRVPEGPLLDLDALFQFVLEESPKDYDLYKSRHAEAFQAIMATLYKNAAWPPESLGTGTPESNNIVEIGKSQFMVHWMHMIESPRSNPVLRSVALLTESGNLFLESEASLLSINAPFASDDTLPASMVVHNRLVGSWEKCFRDIRDARKVLQNQEAAIGDGTLEEAFVKKGKKALELAAASFATLRDQLAKLKEGSGLPGGEKVAGAEKLLGGDTTFLTKLDEDLKAKFEELQNVFQSGKSLENVQDLDKQMFKVVSPAEFGRQAVRAYEIRFRIFKTSHELLMRRVPPGDMFTLAKDIKITRETAAQVRQEITRAAAMSGAPGPRLQRAVESALFATTLAERSQTFAQIKGALDSVRNASQPLIDLAERRAALFDPVQRARVFMAGGDNDAETYPARFHPKVMAEVLANRKILIERVGDPAKSDEAAPQGVLEADALRDVFQPVDTKLRDYFSAYADSWIDVIRRGFQVDAFTWKTFLDRFGEFQQWEINNTLSGTLNAVEDAIKDPDIPLTAAVKTRVENLLKDIGAARNDLKAVEGQDTPFIQKCKTVVASWSAFKGEPAASARLYLLALKPAEIKEKFVLQGTGDRRSVVLRYWEDLTFRTLNALAEDFQANASASLKRLDSYRAFPLALPSDKNDLTAEQVAQCRQILDRLRPDPAALPPGSVGAGAKTDVPRIDQSLGRLAWLEMPADQKKWIMAADKVLAALPSADAGSTQAELTLIGLPSQKNLAERTGEAFETVSALFIWRTLAVRQGKEVVARRQSSDPAEDKVLGGVAYPGENLRIELFKNPSDTLADQKLSEPGPWAPIRMLHHWKAVRGDDPGTWIMEMTIRDAKGFDRKLWLRLKFEHDLPDLDAWPSG